MERNANPRPADTLELIYKAAHGNQDAFRGIADKYEPMIRKIAGQFRLPEGEKDDLFQEGLIGLYKAVLMYDPELSSFSSFAYLCVKSCMLSAVKAYNKKANGLSQFAEEFPEDESLLSPAPDPQTQLVNKESYALLLKRIDSHLSEYENTVLRLYLTGVSHDRIAQKLDTSRKSVDNAISRIRRKLKVLIGPA